LIGNDIIDLKLAKKESNHSRSGFLEKQFSSYEQALIQSASNPFLLVWKLWSMKEATYKVYTQQNKTRFFSPKKFNCEISSDSNGFVSFNDKLYYTSTILNHKYIFTLATVMNPYLIDKSIKIKLEDKTKFSFKEIIKKKSENGVPLFYHKNILLTKSCSISHHGNYGVFSLLL
jgi:phosphopantetheinyl transferase (holo-ACP synthase)